MTDPRTGGHFDDNGNWHDDHPEFLEDNMDGVYVFIFFRNIAFWGALIAIAWFVFRELVRAAL